MYLFSDISYFRSEPIWRSMKKQVKDQIKDLLPIYIDDFEILLENQSNKPKLCRHLGLFGPFGERFGPNSCWIHTLFFFEILNKITNFRLNQAEPL